MRALWSRHSALALRTPGTQRITLSVPQTLSLTIHSRYGSSIPVRKDKRLNHASPKQAPRFNFENMGPADLDKFLRAAEMSNVDLSKKFPDITRVIVREHQFDSPDGLARAAFAMRWCDGRSDEVQKLLEVIASRIRYCRGDFNAVQLSKAMAGLRNMSSESRNVRAVIDAIAAAVVKSPDKLKNRAFGTILYSMKCMSSDSHEVRKLLSVIADQMETCMEPLDGQCVGNMLYGLRGMSSEVSYHSVWYLLRKIDIIVIHAVSRSQEDSCRNCI